MRIELKQADKKWLEEIYDKLMTKMHAECERVGNMIPFIPLKEHYKDLMMPNKLFWWCNGFWPGILWQMYQATEEQIYLDTAQQVEERLAKALEQPDYLDHDVGFMFLLSAVANYRITGNSKSLERGLCAAKLLAERFQEKGEYIRAWNDGTLGNADVSGWMIADCMMNIPLLYWASEVTSEYRYAQIAEKHADTTARFIARADGSANHIVCMDPNTGTYKGAPAGQGYAEGSSWSRGQGWILYGFALSYRHTGKESYLDIAKRCAHYCITCLVKENWLPMVDFRAPAQEGRYDSTAGMIIACGLLELAEHVTEYEREIYISAAMNILKACDNAFNNWNIEVDGIVGGGSLRYHNDKMAGAYIIYGDYYLIEAILRLKGNYLMAW